MATKKRHSRIMTWWDGDVKVASRQYPYRNNEQAAKLEKDSTELLREYRPDVDVDKLTVLHDVVEEGPPPKLKVDKAA